MGGCCCCSSKGGGLNSSPPYYHFSLTHWTVTVASWWKDNSLWRLEKTNCKDDYGGNYTEVEKSKVLIINEVYRVIEAEGGACVSLVEFRDHDAAGIVWYPIVSVEHEPLSSHHGSVSALSTGLLVDTNLETSIPDTYRPPPAPLPYDANLRRPRTSLTNQESFGNKNDAALHTTNTASVEEANAGNTETNAGNTLETSPKDLKGSDCQVQTDSGLASLKDLEVELEKSGELKKSSEPLVPALEEEEDVCPICLEEYDIENPKFITKCEHHFHLACILEWMERSDTCPVCDQEMIFDAAVDV